MKGGEAEWGRERERERAFDYENRMYKCVCMYWWCIKSQTTRMIYIYKIRTGDNMGEKDDTTAAVPTRARAKICSNFIMLILLWWCVRLWYYLCVCVLFLTSSTRDESGVWLNPFSKVSLHNGCTFCLYGSYLHHATILWDSISDVLNDNNIFHSQNNSQFQEHEHCNHVCSVTCRNVARLTVVSFDT